MRPQHLDHFKKIFENQVQAAVGAVPRETAQNDLEEPGDIVDRVSVLQEQCLNHALQNRKHASIQGATAALQRIRGGSFGICEDCEEEIDLRRLEINPTTTVCIQCQEERERYVLLKSAHLN